MAKKSLPTYKEIKFKENLKEKINSLLTNYINILRNYTSLIEDNTEGERLAYREEQYLPNIQTITNLSEEFYKAIEHAEKFFPKVHIEKLKGEYQSLEAHINQLNVSEKTRNVLIGLLRQNFKAIDTYTNLVETPDRKVVSFLYKGREFDYVKMLAKTPPFKVELHLEHPKIQNKPRLLGRGKTQGFFDLQAIRDSYAIIGLMERTGYFNKKELKKFKREYSDLEDRLTELSKSKGGSS